MKEHVTQWTCVVYSRVYSVNNGFTVFVDNKKTIEYHQTYPLIMKTEVALHLTGDLSSVLHSATVIFVHVIHGTLLSLPTQTVG